MAPPAVSSSSTMTRCILRLVIWSAASFSATVATPVSGEPSRFMRFLLEIAGVGFPERQPLRIEAAQRAALGDDAPRQLGPHIGRRGEVPVSVADGLEHLDPLEPGGDPADIDVVGGEIDPE